MTLSIHFSGINMGDAVIDSPPYACYLFFIRIERIFLVITSDPPGSETEYWHRETGFQRFERDCHYLRITVIPSEVEGSLANARRFADKLRDSSTRPDLSRDLVGMTWYFFISLLFQIVFE